jgi:hypothetical protein
MNQAGAAPEYCGYSAAFLISDDFGCDDEPFFFAVSSTPLTFFHKMLRTFATEVPSFSVARDQQNNRVLRSSQNERKRTSARSGIGMQFECHG